VKTFQQVLERAKSRPIYEVTGEDVSVPDMIQYLRAVFEKETDVLPARELFERQKSRRSLICLFLAMLELVKLQAIGLVQADTFGEIGVKRLKGFDTAFASGEAISAIEEGYN
jgi:segregation and condensation protein A